MPANKGPAHCDITGRRKSSESRMHRRSRSSMESDDSQAGIEEEGQLMVEEDRLVGDVSWSVYRVWINAFGGMSAAFMVMNAKEKTGIVGRTGAGKSGLIVGLMRLVELDAGSITVDGVDISKVGLHGLRSKIDAQPIDEFPLDEAIRELLQLVQDTFGDDLQLEHILEEDDQPVQIELQVHEDITDEERMSQQRRAAARRKGIFSIENMDNEEESSETTEREVIRMSRCRKSKLDHLVNKLQREIAQKSEFIADLESVVVEQNRTISQLSATTKQQTRVISEFECQKGMLESDLETTTLMLYKVRAEKQAVEFTLEQVRIDLVLQTNREF
eukprot:jgi/Phyca11/17835/fgenesh1_pg.PHYCAscaffold_31_\